jgi:hypothetical protein
MKYIICFFSLCIIFSGCKSTNDLIKKTNHLSYYANEILVESNLGDKNFKNNFYFSILKVDKLNQTIAFNGIPYFEDDKFDFNKINLDSLFLNT